MYNIKETYSVIWKWFIDHVLPAKTVNITVKSSFITVMLIFLFALPLLLFSYLLFPYSTVKNETEEHILFYFWGMLIITSLAGVIFSAILIKVSSEKIRLIPCNIHRDNPAGATLVFYFLSMLFITVMLKYAPPLLYMLLPS
ncbi:hypothetical protein CHK60_22725 [Salmonella enterica subsp. enterica serovar Stanley]|uniref:Uncharacterized protein n=1 Tax=Salmonella enterica TaxID=28901 RepID=A0A742UFV4_SALER|nr:hypothetical protein [Salmonella enterica subsp. enterica serovar Urbana]ECZ5203274.1 hypothetical protein [Salmonella enterica subsp. enterica serovar Kentucky]EDD6035949.1 hypothetical protein [Salmonella enterica subsp. enterica serovar Stanley]HAF1615649.1 hypothetical protein [Salmonella enterica]EDA9520894.1 hypothetical protein [Salmonella enterica subsp. enterica serovar Kentucky]